MVSIYSVDPNKLIETVAEDLKKISDIKAPEWASFAKTGVFKERPPARDDWWHVRVAAILRSIYKMGPIGVSKLRTKYGGIKNRGVRPEKFFRGSGNIIRKALQQLEKAELVKQDEQGNHKGRVIAPKGKSIMDKAAIAILKTMPKKEVVVEEPKVEKPKKASETKVSDKKKDVPKEVKPAEEVKKDTSETKEKPKVEEKKEEVKPAEEVKKPVEEKDVPKPEVKSEEKPAEAKE